MKTAKNNASAFSLIEVSVVILVIGILVAGITLGSALVKKSRIAAAQTLTVSSPINGIKDSALWLETAVDASFAATELSDGDVVSLWYDNRSNAANKPNITVAGTGPVYSNTINYVHAVKFSGSSSNYLQIADPTFLNNTNYTVFILEKRQSNAANNYFFGENPSGTANQNIALGYSLDGTVIHSQGTNSYTSNVSSYADSTNKPRIFTFIHDSSSGKKTYINGVLAAQNSDTSAISGLTTNLAIGKSYTGEIGEIAIFTRALKNEERKAIEDYIGKKWTAKINRDSVPNGSCISGTITTNGCSMNCATSSFPGISAPSSITDGQTSSATCGAVGFDGSSVSLTCLGGSLSGASCTCATGYKGSSCSTCDNDNGYFSNGSGGCVVAAGCSVSATGITTSSVAHGASGSASCSGLYSGSVNYNCNNGNPNITGSCFQNCTTGSTIGINTQSITAASGTLNCNAANFNTSDFITYTCSGGVFTVTGGTACDTCSSGSFSGGACGLAQCTVTGSVTTDTTTVTGSVIHKFTGSGTINCPSTRTVQALIVAGGGGGGNRHAGGGGGGGLISATPSLTASTPYSIVVGGGGTGSKSGSQSGTSGENSTFAGLTAIGGGGGGGNTQPGLAGGSGGGGANGSFGGNGTAGQGNKGGNQNNGGGCCYPNGAGGGGAGAAGANTSGGQSSVGGIGVASSITGISTYYAGGGGGGANGGSFAGGLGGGGASMNNAAGAAGTNGLGGGGGGGAANGGTSENGGNGGSGVVIVRY